MKRINLKTNSLFKLGDTREDGYLFWNYCVSKKIKKNGFFSENWYSPIKFNMQIAKVNNRYKTAATIIKNQSKTWNYNNKDKTRSKTAKRRSAKKQRVLPWLTQEHFKQIEEFYTRAKMFQMDTGQEYHVDHIVPLQGKNVSGFHAPWNLQVIPAKENLSKGNRHGV